MACLCWCCVVLCSVELSALRLICQCWCHCRSLVIGRRPCSRAVLWRFGSSACEPRRAIASPPLPPLLFLLSLSSCSPLIVLCWLVIIVLVLELFYGVLVLPFAMTTSSRDRHSSSSAVDVSIVSFFSSSERCNLDPSVCDGYLVARHRHHFRRTRPPLLFSQQRSTTT